MKKFHLALGVKDIQKTVEEYTKRFECEPVIVIDNEYALFRTETLNISIRKGEGSQLGLRHLGWESDEYTECLEEIDCNGWVWETFSKEAQIKEILEIWPGSI
jgi:hypothetical protein